MTTLQTNDPLEALLEDARRHVATANGHTDVSSLDDDNLRAQLSFEAIQLAEKRRKSYRKLQAMIVMDMIRRNNLWLAYPTHGDHPDGFGSLREFLTATGISATAVSDLSRLEELIPFCDTHGIPIDDHVTDKFGLLIAAGRVLRRAVRDNDVVEATSILDDVNHASGREAIREKYAVRRQYVAGGGMHNLSDGRVVLAVVIDDSDGASVIAQRLSSLVGWNLVAAVTEFTSSIRVTINDPS